MKLSYRIISGFGIVLAIALILTGASVYIMRGVAGQARILSNQFMPQTRIASNIERHALRAVSAMDRYDGSYDDAFLSASREQMKNLKADLKDAEQLIGRFPELALLKANTLDASQRLSEYEQLVDNTENIGKEIKAIRKKLESVADSFMVSCIEFLDAHTQELTAGFKEAGSNPAYLASLLENIRNMSDVIQIGYVIQLDTTRSELLRNPQLIEESAKKFLEIENILSAAQKKTTSDTSISQLEDIRIAGSNYKTQMKKLMANYLALIELGKKREDTGNAVSVTAENTSVSGIEETVKSSADVEHILNSSNTTVLVGSVFGFSICLVLIYFVTRSISGPIGRIIEGLNDGADQVASAAGEVSALSQSLADGTSEQAASIEETSSSLEEMASMTRQSAENARQADALMKQANQVVNQANNSMGDLIVSMKDISKASEETSKIIKTIDEIAFQTNLLALNAAVEAARAGEAGAGFAVVADEVRNLALRAADAARNTSDLIEGTVKKVKGGSLLVSQTSDVLSAVAENALKAGELVGEIAAASHEQSEGIGLVNKAVAEMDKVIQRNAANAEESASASEELNAQAEQMKGYVEEMKALVEGKRKRFVGSEKALLAFKKDVSHQGPVTPI